jgi:hypothetical protein
MENVEQIEEEKVIADNPFGVSSTFIPIFT